MNMLFKNTVSVLAACSIMAGTVSALPASAAEELSADGGISVTLGAFTSSSPKVSKSYTSTDKYVKISWKKLSGASGYRVYRKTGKNGKYKAIATLKGGSVKSYKDTGVKPGTQYSYKVKAYKGSAKNYTWSKASSAVYTATKPEKVKEITKIWGKNATARLKWSKVSKADGYIVYYLDEYNNKWRTAATINSANTTSTKIRLSDLKYANSNIALFRVKSFSTAADGKKVTSSATKPELYINMEAWSEGYAKQLRTLAKAKKSSSVTNYVSENAQGKKSTSVKVYIPDNDLAAIKKFAKVHFDSSWTDEQKVMYTWLWINRCVTYDYEMTHIKSGYADSIFEARYGQCIQYNGALLETLCWLGYKNCTLVQGWYSNTTKQHFWTEIKIKNTIYVMETGNYGKNGNWRYFCAPYKDTSGYIKNNKEQ